MQIALWAYRTTTHSITGVSPTFLVYGIGPTQVVDIPLLANDPILTEFDQAKTILERIQDLETFLPRIRKDQDFIIDKQNIKRTNSPGTFEIGDAVWLRLSKYDEGNAPVFARRWEGPFRVYEKWQKNVYKLRTMATDKLITRKNPINGDRLRRFLSYEDERYLFF